MKTNLKKIKGILGKFKGFQVSPEFDRKIFKAIKNTRAEHEFKVVGPSFFTYLTNIFMNNIKKYALTALAAIFVFGGVMYFNQNSYAYHLHKAKNALAELQAIVQGNPNYASLIPGAFAEDAVVADADGESASEEDAGILSGVDEERVVELAQEVVSETQAAIEVAENITNPSELENALNEINDVQTQAVDVLSEAIGAVESEDATQALADALETTVAEEVLVSQAADFARQAADEGETNVYIDIETSADNKLSAEDESETSEEDAPAVQAMIYADAQNRYQEAKKAIEELRNNGASSTELARLESKLLKVEQALDEGKTGRAYGLTTAIQAKSRNIVRKAEKMIKKAEKQNNNNVLDEIPAMDDGAESENADFDDAAEDAGSADADTSDPADDLDTGADDTLAENTEDPDTQDEDGVAEAVAETMAASQVKGNVPKNNVIKPAKKDAGQPAVKNLPSINKAAKDNQAGKKN